jgi:hypothetical protein
VESYCFVIFSETNNSTNVQIIYLFNIKFIQIS